MLLRTPKFGHNLQPANGSDYSEEESREIRTEIEVFADRENAATPSDVFNRILRLDDVSPGTVSSNATIIYEGNTYGNISRTATLNADLPTEWAVVMGVIVGIIVAFLGLVGNSITIGAYRRNRKLRTSFNFLITNLCAVDLIFSTVVIPTHLPMMITRGNVYNVHWCSAVGYLYYSSLSSSVINLVCIAINRYVGIVHSKRYRHIFARELAKWWLIGIWISAPALYLPLLIMNSIQWRPSSMRCALSSSRHEATSIRSYQIALNIALQAIPTIALALFYRAILRKVKKCRKTVEHYPVTNSPSVATSCMLAGGVVGLPAAGDTSPKLTTCRKSCRCKSRSIARDNDVTEGKKAMIMAYLQVPSTTVSPRKNPGSLYKRSPPQTRTMIVPETEGGQTQVLISGTTSSPNLAKGKIDPVPVRMAISAGRCSPTRWGKQRSFSQGDEEIEPESGMIGDTEGDLPQIQTLALRLPTYESSHDNKKTFCQQELLSPDCVLSISDDAFESSNSTKETRKIPCIAYRADCRDSKCQKEPMDVSCLSVAKKVDQHENASENNTTPPVSVTHKAQSSDLDVDPPQAEGGYQPPGGFSRSSKKKLRMLTRQRTIDEDADCRRLIAEKERPDANTVSSLVLSIPTSPGNERVKNVRQSSSSRSLSNAALRGQLSPPSTRISSIMDFPAVKPTKSVPGCASSLLSPVPGLEAESPTAPPSEKSENVKDSAAWRNGSMKRARYITQATSSSSDKYTSQGTEMTSLTTENQLQKEEINPELDEECHVCGDKALHPSTIPNDVTESELSKRIMLRRGASDIGGVRWLRRFRKSRNWSMSSSTKQSKYRIRGAAGMRKETIIKIIIENATEELGDSEPDCDPEFSPSMNLYDIASEGSADQEESNAQRNEGQSVASKRDDSVEAITENKKKAESKIPKCCWNLWNKLVVRYRPPKKSSHETTPSQLDSCDCNHDADLIDECPWHESCSDSSKTGLERTGLRDVGIGPPVVGGWNGAIDSPGVKGKFKPIVMLPIPQLTIQKESPDHSPVEQKGTVGDHVNSSAEDECRDKRIDFAAKFQKRLWSGGDSAGSGSHDTDIISSKENEILLEKRRNMNVSSQCLRAGNMALSPSPQDDDSASLCDAGSINLGRRWSGQSDAISIYSGRYMMSSNPKIAAPQSNISQRGSISALSGVSPEPGRKQSKKSEGSGGSGTKNPRDRRKSIYQKWVSKKSSIVSSVGSNSSRRRRRDAERRLAYSGLAICVAFAICVLPTSVVGVLLSTTPIEVPSNIKFGVAVLSWLHAVVNPILYGFLNPQYRAEYRRMFRDAWRWIRCEKDDRAGFGRGASKSAIVQRMRQQYESEDLAGSQNKKSCNCLCRKR